MADGDTLHVNGEEENKELTIEKDTTEALKKVEVVEKGAGDAAECKTDEVKSNGESEKEEQNEDNETPTDLEHKIIRQIEYYFGDINLPKDKFLKEQIKTKDGWIPLDTMLNFKRLAALTTDKSAIVKALRKSKNKLMEVSEDETEIRRDPSKPLPQMNEERRAEMATRTIYVKGFTKTTKFDNILDFFNRLTTVENVIMRNYMDRATKSWLFKGSVFVVFPTRDAAESFLKMESVKYEGTELNKMWQIDYYESKRKERLAQKNLKRKRGDNTKEREEVSNTLPKNSVLHFSSCPEKLTREIIKKKMEEFPVSVAFVDFTMGNKEGWVRLQEEGQAVEVFKKLEDGKLELCETQVDVRVLEGDEETQFLNKVKEDMAKRRNQAAQRSRKGRRGGGGRGGGGQGNRKRKGSPSRDEATPAKVSATE